MKTNLRRNWKNKFYQIFYELTKNNLTLLLNALVSAHFDCMGKGMRFEILSIFLIKIRLIPFKIIYKIVFRFLKANYEVREEKQKLVTSIQSIEWKPKQFRFQTTNQNRKEKKKWKKLKDSVIDNFHRICFFNFYQSNDTSKT